MAVCRHCGTTLCLAEHGRARVDEVNATHVEQVARAVCGCYVFAMPDYRLGLLMASVIAADEFRRDVNGSQVCASDCI